jgi:hypothetical protein
MWYYNGKYNRVPPSTYTGWANDQHGNKSWYCKGKREDIDGITFYTLDDGTKVNEIPDTYTGIVFNNKYYDTYWYKDGGLHRVGGPAWEWADGSRSDWYYHNKRHRLDGPAVEKVNGIKAWWVNNKILSKESKLILVLPKPVMNYSAS